jgi:hypothetical protein
MKEKKIQHTPKNVVANKDYLLFAWLGVTTTFTDEHTDAEAIQTACVDR